MNTENKYIDEVLQKGFFYDDKQTPINVQQTSIDTFKAAVIQQIISDKKLKTSVEVGCAYGTSSMVICNSILKNGDGINYILDPFQELQWKNEGVKNLERAKLSNFKLIQEKSEFALPELLKSGLKIDFAFIDGWHTFDHTLLDFFYINRMLNKGGVLAFDDCNWKSIAKLMKYVRQYPCYRLLFPQHQNKIGVEEKVTRKIASIFTDKYKKKIFSDRILYQTFDISSSIVAFEKITEDERGFDWFENF